MADDLIHYHGAYLAIVERDGWEFATRTNASGVAVIVPLTGAGELVLVEQYRVPVRRRVLELPAGLVGDGNDPDEDMLLAAQRELEEETGYRAARMTPLLTSPSTAGLSDEMITFFLAEGLELVGPGGGDASEDIQVHQISLAEVGPWLERRQAEGVFLDPKIYAALYWLQNLSKAPASAPATKG